MEITLFTILKNIFLSHNVWCYLAAYLIGAIPSGLLIGKYLAGVNIKESGSGSIGATNVLRVLKEQNPKKAKKLAILTIVCDVLKGVVPILIAKFLGFDPNVLWAMAVFAVLGHCFSPYLGFEGGKGVATAAGVLAIFIPLELLIAVIAWFISGKTIKISSVASFIAIIALVIAMYIIHPQMPHINTHAPVFVIIFIIIYKHIPNIVRLIKGEEKRVI
ncbi:MULTISPECIES: glycerol-3-phosphate 1-O-acyltransferase PlsY [unclassified Campylobacter]|uniref:glycerol-3-phosphate 1-O-acyltransferase PlsY n=1 Tax=unclassified Campylobacter TaxID=2593542 RepID=UPI0022E9DC88|nr:MULTISPECIES: glycerol-3-phosphate 1-O-acyltransferase PlsY [unclassified Campylobacter]MBQ3674401.1 glycerol-3-phosphate 1-O-acyltransferase PlsY [Campylobacter sp.]MDA3079216.1 glycerol-3-phosphate 1-O-acyltransferase PlsY [Campylobacter sp. CS_NA2]MDA3080481.1 glycerol-3-phosphate 1-O-acyltransferase PlsY [Campylobacter sp. CS_NA1]MDA3085314.1 glycerol-3-phosphate 1-O-acyltransferase PlsY [Campylobacter sp. CS_ED1]MDA3090091.1 glycerol-3-phosphate 1-O-acyltransferase PlsY [Campylobacter 